MESIVVSKAYKYTCDRCNKVQEAEAFPREWIRISEVVRDGLRLYERPSKTTRYESFHIPGKENKDYCSTNCAMENYKQSLDLFFRELRPIKINPKSQPLT